MSKWWWPIVLLSVTIGCSDDASKSQCPGGGDDLAVDGAQVCVYDTRRSSIIETGFTCPQDRADMTQFGDLIVCSDGEPPGGIEDELAERYPFANLEDDDCVDVLCSSGTECVDGTCEPTNNLNDQPNVDENNDVCVPTVEICGDQIDNDCDEDVDCEDADCGADPLCTTVPTCADPFEPNDDAAQASPVGLPPTDSALCGDDVDYWLTSAQDADIVAVRVSLLASANVVGELVKANGDPVYDVDAQPIQGSAPDGLADGMFVFGGQLRRGDVGPFYVRLSGDDVEYRIEVETTTLPRFGSAIEVGAGGQFTCALQQSGTVFCWGANDRGQLGDRQAPSFATPLEIVSGLTASRLWVGPEHSCALMADGHPYCWGDNTYGEVGALNVGGPSGVAQTSGLVGVEEMALGRDHTCALAGGSVYCWGRHGEGQLGDPTNFDFSSTTPLLVAVVDDAVSIAAGDNHTCVTRQDQTIWCWGQNTADQLCDPDIFEDESATALEALCYGVQPMGTSLSARGDWTLVHGSDGFGHGWGDVPRMDPTPGGVGNLLDIPQSSAFDPVPTATATWAGHNSWCRLEAAGLACRGYGPWLDGSTVLAGGDEFASTTQGVYAFYTKNVTSPLDVSLGVDHHCVVEADGELICWGRNAMGQLGDGTTTNRAWPVYVSAP